MMTTTMITSTTVEMLATAASLFVTSENQPENNNNDDDDDKCKRSDVIDRRWSSELTCTATGVRIRTCVWCQQSNGTGENVNKICGIVGEG